MKNGQSRDTGKIGHTRHIYDEDKQTNKRQRKPQGQSRMDNPETLTRTGTQDIYTTKTNKQINVRENHRGNQEWTIQSQDRAHKTYIRRRQTNK